MPLPAPAGVPGLGLNGDFQTFAEQLFHVAQGIALVIEQIQAQLARRFKNAGGRAGGLQPRAEIPKRLKSLPFQVAPETGAAAGGARLKGDGKRRGAHALPHKFQQAKGTHPGHVMPGAIVLHGLTQGFFHLQHMLLVTHFDEVDDHLTANIPQPQMPGNDFRGLHVRLEGHGLEIALA